MMLSKDQEEFYTHLACAVVSLNAIVKTHLTDGSGKCEVSFKNVEAYIDNFSQSLIRMKQQEENARRRFEDKIGLSFQTGD